jgi:hypothetical protein
MHGCCSLWYCADGTTPRPERTCAKSQAAGHADVWACVAESAASAISARVPSCRILSAFGFKNTITAWA